MNRNPKRRTTGTFPNGCYLPPSIEKNIRSFEYFPVSRENTILSSKPYGRLGYGEESKFSRENSINSYKAMVELNNKNYLNWNPEKKSNTLGSENDLPRLFPINDYPFPISDYPEIFNNEDNISLIDQFILSTENFMLQFLV